MLTKELLRYRIINGVVRPLFVKTDNPALLELADELLAVYRQGKHSTRNELDEIITPLINSSKDALLARGFNKLILDRTEFSHGETFDYPALRSQIFAASGKLLKDKRGLSYNDFKKKMDAACSLNADFVEKGIYADLPENEKLISFKDIAPDKLLERYNCSLVQSLLLTSKSITIIISEPEAAKMRRMLNYLKFFRLLCRIYKYENNGLNSALLEGEDEGDNTAVRLVIDGPLSLFEGTRKYSLQIASFFPAVCDMSQWELQAEVKCRRKNVSLKVNQESNLKSHYKHFGSYVPGEISLFEEDFRDKIKDWKIIEHSLFLDGGNGELIFPDFSFRNNDGAVIHLELFHRWHSGQLATRLKYGSANPDIPLIIGVDRYLYNKGRLKTKIKNRSWFNSNGFLFRDFPTVDTVRKCLEKLVANGFPRSGHWQS